MRQLQLSTIILSLILNLFSCGANLTHKEKIPGYDLSHPDKTSTLPDTLREISEITRIDSATFACIQDENGILFIFDPIKNEITQQCAFNIDGDYEGIACVGDTIYVLRSDGTLFEIINFSSEHFKLKSYSTGIPANNNEGLCYDAENNRLLIACKGKIGKGPELKDKRVIYGFELSTKKLTSEPVYNFDLQEIKEYLIKNNVDIPTKTRKKKGELINEPQIKFRASAISIHPLTNKLFLLSASDYLLFVINMNGKIEKIVTLSPSIFNKAEGIAFFNNGDMLITNEGQDKKPTVLYFKYKK